ncbi:four-carbon acid sugar kinase family protein [Pasteurella testudinis]|uniref:four-carbon acid sugar kinase family protein n=1 Tax=Pasteurella testudinis TaxID=761 RepID=UPI004059B4E6
MKNNILVIADDLTGANDTGVMFAENGFSTILQVNSDYLHHTDFSQAEVFTVSTDTRPVGEKAVQLTKSAVEAGLRNGIEQIYLKIDSTMRGSVAYQIEGALQAWRLRYPEAKAVICPAYPEMGRTIEQGCLYVNGIPVHETASGRDPICPVPSASMDKLLPQAAIISGFTSEQELLHIITTSAATQLVVDAKTVQDLSLIANVIAQLGNQIIPVGSAGLAQVLKKSANKPASHQAFALSRALILVTSVHETSQAQVDEYIATTGGKTIVFSPHPSQLINATISEPALKQQLKALINCSKENVIIRANPAKINAAGNINEIARTISGYLADLGKYCLDHADFDTLILFGGDGAAALLACLPVYEMKILHAVVAGVPLCRIAGGTYQGLKVMTKSGGFGDKQLLSHIMQQHSNK